MKSSESFKNKIAEHLIKRTRIFPIMQSIKNAYDAEDDLIASIRSFYLLLPVKSLTNEWPSINKFARREVIKEHLKKVCDNDKINKLHIKIIDTWINARYGSRDNLERYGRILEDKNGNVCFYCGKRIDTDKAVDHIFPFSKGGEDSIENFFLVHGACNASKNSHVPGEFIQWASSEPESQLNENINRRIKFLVFLRDNFTCKKIGCNNGLFSNVEIKISKKYVTGICTYDNLITVCDKCEEY
ncbi:MAG: HNH endonuclease [Candidatus Pacebacteria bacterium]|nr:HNH endonuclease [Candidatus Paceibacterota bacterium]